MAKELLFSVTAKDCEWEYYRGSGPGGQKKQKSSTAVRCTHKPSGAVGQAQDTRSQAKNKQLAFKRMANSKKFRDWVKIEAARVTGAEAAAKAYAEREINSDRIRIEVKRDGKWLAETQKIELPKEGD